MWKNVFIPATTQHAAQVGKTSDKKAGQSQRDGPEADHGFFIDVSAVSRHDKYSFWNTWTTGRCTSWYEPAGQHKNTGDVLPKRYNSKFTKGNESIPTDGYDTILVCTPPKQESIC